MESKNHTNIVHNQDARSILKFISPEIKVRTTITSPPYYTIAKSKNSRPKNKMCH